MILVDSNIFLDILTHDPVWLDWSERKLNALGPKSPICANAVIAAEIAPQVSSRDQLISFFDMLAINIKPLTIECAFWAGKAHTEYRRRGGRRETMLADFLIAGNAITLNAQILTRDPKRFRDYFPDLTLITPETHP